MNQLKKVAFVSNTACLANENSGSGAGHQSAVAISKQSDGCPRQSSRPLTPNTFGTVPDDSIDYAVMEKVALPSPTSGRGVGEEGIKRIEDAYGRVAGAA